MNTAFQPRKNLEIERLESRLPMAILIVNTLDDIVDRRDPWLSLREAVRMANDTEEVDEIRFDASLSGGTIQLRRGEILGDFERPVNIVGPGAQLLTIDASASDPTPQFNQGDGSRIFNELSGAITGLTLVGGDVSGFTGGGAIVCGDLVVRDMVFRDNYSAKEAGAIHAFGNVEIYSSWFDGNSAFDDGGAIYTFSSLRVEDSSFTHNFTDGSQGASGGAIAARTGNGEFVVHNSTFSGNEIRQSGQGGAIDFAGLVTGRIVNSTIVNNSSGFAPGISIRDGSFEIYNTVIADNIGGRTGDIFLTVPEVQVQGVLIGNAGNLIIDDTDTVYFGRSNNPLDPQLSPLINDGQSNPYHLPLAGSLLIDRGVDDVGTTKPYDQRGVPYWRTFGQIDIGSTESVGASDLNENGRADLADIALLCDAIHSMTSDLMHDLNGDQQVNKSDHQWMITYWHTKAGDANLDRRFASSDLVAVFVAGEYEDGIANNSRWSSGDWNCDGDFDSKDLILAFQAAWFEKPLMTMPSVNSDTALAAHWIRYELGFGHKVGNRSQE